MLRLSVYHMHKQFIVVGMCHPVNLHVLSECNPQRFIWQIMLHISLWEVLNRNLGSYFYPYACGVQYQECCYAICYTNIKGKVELMSWGK